MILIKEISVTPIYQNCRIIWNEETKDAFIIDPGEEKQEIVDFINDNNLKLNGILLTHSHFDHAGGCDFIMKKYPDAKLYATKIEEELRKQVMSDINFYGVPSYPANDCNAPYIALEDNMEIFLGDEKFICLFTPGHTKGSVCFYNEKNKLLFSGDTLFKGAIGRTDLKESCPDKIIKSIKEKLLVLPDDTMVFAGHGKETTIFNEKLYNPYLM